jgi:hypothetical protein
MGNGIFLQRALSPEGALYFAPKGVMSMAGMATDPNLMGIRDTLKSKYNIGDERIGYDGEYVTIDGQRAIKPTKNVGGTTYADQATWNSAAGGINALNNSYNVMQKLTGMTDGSGQANPYDQQVSDLISQLRGNMTNQTPLTMQDVMANPMYAAQQATIGQQAQQATRAAQEALGASGFGRSTNLADRAQSIQNDASNYLNTQVVPVIMQQMQGERDRQTNALMSLLDVLGGQQSLYDARENNDFNQMLGLLEYNTGRQDRAWDVNPDNPQNRAVILQNQMNELKLKNLPEEMRLTLDRLQQQVDAGEIDLQTAEYELNELTDPNSITNQTKRLALEAERLGNQKLRKEIEHIGKVPALTQYEQEMQKLKLEMAKVELQNAKDGGGNKDFEAEKQGLVTAIRSGGMTPGQAIQQIDEDTSLGFYTPQEAAELRSIITKMASSESNRPMTPEQQAKDKATRESIKATIPSDKEIEAEARKLGYPTMDYRSYYKDPNGKTAGLSFEQWRKLYGPKLSGG